MKLAPRRSAASPRIQRKRGAPWHASLYLAADLRQHRSAGRRCRSALAFEFLTRLLGAPLQLVLQPFLLFLEYFWIGRRAVIGLGEIGQRQNEADRLAGTIDALHHEPLPLLQLADQLAARFVIRHATILETDDIRPSHWLTLVDDDTRTRLDRHAERESHAKYFLLLPFRLDHDGGDHRHSGFDPSILAGETDLLGVGLLTLQAEFRPGRENELRLLLLGLLARRWLGRR